MVAINVVHLASPKAHVYTFNLYFLFAQKESTKEKAPEMITFVWPFACYACLKGATGQPTSSRHFRFACAPLKQRDSARLTPFWGFFKAPHGGLGGRKPGMEKSLKPKG
jgi:hypothetical protein